MSAQQSSHFVRLPYNVISRPSGGVGRGARIAPTGDPMERPAFLGRHPRGNKQEDPRLSFRMAARLPVAPKAKAAGPERILASRRRDRDVPRRDPGSSNRTRRHGVRAHRERAGTRLRGRCAGRGLLRILRVTRQLRRSRSRRARRRAQRDQRGTGLAYRVSARSASPDPSRGDPIEIARPCPTSGVRRVALSSRPAGSALLLAGAVCTCAPARAQAESRFGDSAWAAPASPTHGACTTAGPHVVPRDHERRWERAPRVPLRVGLASRRFVATGLEACVGKLGPCYLDSKAPHPAAMGPVVAPHVSLGALDDIGVCPAVAWAGFPAPGEMLHLTGSWSAIDRRRVFISETNEEPRPVGISLSADHSEKRDRRCYGLGNGWRVADRSCFRLASAGTEPAPHVGSSPLRQVRAGGDWSSMSTSRGSHGTPAVELALRDSAWTVTRVRH